MSVHDFCELQLETDTIKTQCDVRQASKGLWLEEGKKRCRKRHQTREMSFEEKIQREKKNVRKDVHNNDNNNRGRRKVVSCVIRATFQSV